MIMAITRGTTAVAVAALVLAARFVSAGEGEKLLVGFEIDEMKPKDSGGAAYVVGKPWQGEGPKAGWRWKDHEAELKLPEGYDGDVTIYECAKSSSRDAPTLTLFKTGATQGRHAMRWTPRECEAASWANIESALKQKRFSYWPPPGVPTHSSENPYYFFERFCKVWRFEQGGGDWSAWERLRVDVLAPDAPVVLGLFVRDASGPRISCGPLGVRTSVAVFKVPKGEQVTLDFPLKELAAVAELDVTKAWRYQCRVNGYEGASDIYFDSIRLAGKDTPAKYRLIAMEGEPEPFTRPVYYKPIERVVEKLKRAEGPVEKVGPLDVGTFGGGYASVPSHFGAEGYTYGQNTIRACVAYDNQRLLMVFGAEGALLAAASFDGGATWGGIAPGEVKPTRLNWGLRANTCADEFGDIYMVGTPNCDSYNEGHDICMFRLVFTGERWVDGQFAHLGQNGYKCTAWARALRLPSGRVWAVWCDGWGKGIGLAKYSDDNGYTWVPCKDASAKLPRKFYSPKLEDLKKSLAERPRPPEKVLLWPEEVVAGPFLVPYKGSVAVISRFGDEWQVHDGQKWGPRQKGPALGGLISEAIFGEDHVFIAGANKGSLKVAELKDGVWGGPVELDTGVSDSILTVSGASLFCFYTRKAGEKDEVRYRRWSGGSWEPSQMVASEGFTINHVAAPTKCPPAYAAVWWDERGTNSRKPTVVRFARVPNR
ncbi:MAG: hypothetical protein V1809_09995 [Planctomycetota bacterium]